MKPYASFSSLSLLRYIVLLVALVLIPVVIELVSGFPDLGEPVSWLMVS